MCSETNIENKITKLETLIYNTNSNYYNIDIG